MTIKENRQCEYCGQDYKPRKKSNKYCGNDCYVEFLESRRLTVVCAECNQDFKAPRHERRKFCNQSCAAVYNNRLTPKRRPEGICKIETCNNLIRSSASYCVDHKKTYTQVKKDQKIQDWIEGNWPGGTQYGLSTIIRNLLLEQADYKCSKCGFNTPHPDDNKTILEINHINGDGTDHSKENLEVICPNCHALTSNYRARNMGKGRPHYYLRVSKA